MYDFVTDHRLIRIKLRTNHNQTKKIYKKIPTKKEKEITNNPKIYEDKVEEKLNKIKKSNKITELSAETLNTAITQILNETAEKTNPKKGTNILKESDKERIRELYKKRHQILKKSTRTQNDKIELNIISKAIKIKRREKRRKGEEEITREILEGNKNLKQLRKELSIGKSLTTYMENAEGKKCYNREEINKIAT